MNETNNKTQNNYRHKITWLKPPKRYSIAIIAQPKSPQAQIYKPTSHQANHPTHPPDVRHGSFHAPGCHQPTLGPNMKKMHNYLRNTYRWSINVHSRSLTWPLKMVVGRLVSFSGGNFSGVVLNFGRVVGTFNISSSMTDIKKETQLYTSSSIFIPHETYKKTWIFGGCFEEPKTYQNLTSDHDTIGVTLEILGVQTVHLPSHCFHHPSPQ